MINDMINTGDRANTNSGYYYKSMPPQAFYQAQQGQYGTRYRPLPINHPLYSSHNNKNDMTRFMINQPKKNSEIFRSYSFENF